MESSYGIACRSVSASSRPTIAEPVQQLLIHIDALKDAVDLEGRRRRIVDWLAAPSIACCKSGACITPIGPGSFEQLHDR